MASEALLIQQLEDRFLECTIANGSVGSDVEKFTLMKLSTPNTIAASAGEDLWGGVLAAEKVGGGGSTRAAVLKHNVFRMSLAAGGNVTVGDMVGLSDANLIGTVADPSASEGNIIGMALSSATAGASCEVLGR